jgi:hypothetical protein
MATPQPAHLPVRFASSVALLLVVAFSSLMRSSGQCAPHTRLPTFTSFWHGMFWHRASWVSEIRALHYFLSKVVVRTSFFQINDRSNSR